MFILQIFWFILILWVGSIVGAIIVAGKKDLNEGAFCVLAILFGPLGLILALISPSREDSQKPLSSPSSLDDAHRELGSIKQSLFSLQNRIINLEQKINKLLEKAPGEKISPQPTVTAKPRLATAKQEAFEFTFGKYWLNRIGIVIFVLGVAFFISYTFRYLNAFAKIALGYAAAVGFFIWGNFLEKKKRYQRIAWGILGGAWALLYLSTYAMHYIEATYIISNAVVELLLLAAVSFTTIIYNLKYRSWVVTSITFLLAFITAGLGGIEYSTIIYCAFLVGAITYISYKLKWYEFLLFGIGGIYITYTYWLFPQIFSSMLVTQTFNIPVYQFQLIFSILSISWFIFSLTLFLMNSDSKEKLRYIVAGTLLNAGFYLVLGLNELYRISSHIELDWDIRFWFLIGLGVLYCIWAYFYRSFDKKKLIVSNGSIALSLLVMAIFIRVPKLNIGFFWLIEMLIIFTLGLYYREIVYRILASVLGGLLVLRLFFVDYFSHRSYIVLGMVLKHNIAIFIFAALCFYILGALMHREKFKRYLNKEEVAFYNIFVIVGTVLLTFLFEKEIKSKWLSLSWALEGIGILTAGFLLKQKIYRLCALSIFSLACLRLVSIDMAGMNTIYKIATFIFLGAIFLGASLVYSKFISKLR